MYHINVATKPISIKGNDLIELAFSLSGDDIVEEITFTKVLIEKMEELAWFSKNEKNIRDIDLPTCVKSDKNISSALLTFYENVSEENIELLELVYSYRKQHGFRFAFRGTNIADIYIGKVDNKYFISSKGKGHSWWYEVDIDYFFLSLKRII